MDKSEVTGGKEKSSEGGLHASFGLGLLVAGGVLLALRHVRWDSIRMHDTAISLLSIFGGLALAMGAVVLAIKGIQFGLGLVVLAAQRVRSVHPHRKAIIGAIVVVLGYAMTTTGVQESMDSYGSSFWRDGDNPGPAEPLGWLVVASGAGLFVSGGLGSKKESSSGD